MLQIQHIAKDYGKQPAIKDISFSVAKGEIVGFLGVNGAGKSTTMKIITGCLSPDKGDVLIGGDSIAKHPNQAKRKVGYLSENNPLYGDMYVREYLEYVVRMYAPQANALNRVEAIIHSTGLLPEAHKKIQQLSKGYRQRVGLAQAFVHEPELLVLDEPITGLDPNQIDEIQQFLIDQSRDKAILFSSHTLSEVSSVCTRIIIIHQGEIVLDKPMKDVDNLSLTFKELTNQ